jgi:hypothetical protein
MLTLTEPFSEPVASIAPESVSQTLSIAPESVSQTLSIAPESVSQTLSIARKQPTTTSRTPIAITQQQTAANSSPHTHPD